LTGADARGVVVLAGPSGVGKTRLGQQCLVVAERAGMACEQASATRAAAQLPFGALAPLLPEAPPEPGAVDDLLDLLRRSAAALAERSGGKPLLLFVDDAHLLDDASATLVHQIAATGVASVLVTVLSGEAAPDPIVALWKDGLAARIELGPLSAEDTDELLAAVVGGQVDPATAVQFTERCQGNALFLRELVVGALEDGSLEDDGGIWRLRRGLSPSARLVEIVEAHLGRLDDDERALMELVAYGEPLGQAELDGLSDPGLAESLERRELLASHVDGRRITVRLAHPLYGDVVRARTPALRAVAIARSLADAVEASGSEREEDVLRLATWRLASGGGPADVLLRGAAVARWRYDFRLAEALALAAAETGAGFDAELLAAKVASLQGRRDEAEDRLAALAERAADGGDDDDRGRVAIARFDNSVAWIGRDELQVLDDAESRITDPEWRDRLDARRAGVLLNTRGPRAAANAAEPLLARASGEALVFTCLVGGLSLARLGRFDAALDAAERGRNARLAIPNPLAWYLWWHTVTRCHALAYAGRFAEAEELVAEQHREAVAQRSPEAQGVFAALAAETVGERGRVRTAARRAREALALGQQLDRPLQVRQARILGALALALAGQADEAAAELEELDALGMPPVMRDQTDLLQARAWVAVASGDLPAARGHLEHAAEVGHEVGDMVGESSALHGLARLGRAREVVDRLADAANAMDGDLPAARANHAEALARGDADALDKVSGDFEAMGADLLAAEAASDAAVARRQAGSQRDAAASERRAGVLAERAEDPVTPALQSIETRARLTPAERETAALAAGGRSNREIADHLFLSSRTVENRLQRVYEKLGITGRGELPDALGAAGDGDDASGD
jgi:DNA-binding CsgD family transcriptional regulator